MTLNISSAGDASPTSLHLGGVDLQIIRRGTGRPILFLHPDIGLTPDLSVLDLLAARGELIAPSHPGFMGSSLPRHFSTVDDLAYFYLDLLEMLDLSDVLVVASSLGAWIAAEMGIKTCERFSHLVLAGPVGIKIGEPLECSVVDVFTTDAQEFKQLAYADPNKAPKDVTQMSDDEAEIAARNREATALYGWLPYMYDPKLCHRLHRIKVPTLIVKGDQDRVITGAYCERFAQMIPSAKLVTIDGAGHFPYLEQPQRFVEQIFAFIDN